MATILKPVRLVNPGKRKRRLTARQKLFFGSKRQRAAVSRTLHNGPGKRKREYYPHPGRKEYGGRPGGNRKMMKSRKTGSFAKQDYYQNKHVKRRRAWKKRTSPSRLPNVGEIITIRPLINSGYKAKGTRKRRKLTNMAKSAKRRAAGLKAARTRKRNKAARRTSSHRRRSTRRRRTNPGVMVHRRRRRRGNARRNPGVRYIRRHAVRRRRNPGVGLGGDFGKVVGIIGGALVTKIATGFLPASLTQGVLGYLSIGIVAMLQGKAVGKILKNPVLGRDMQTGGYVYLALKVASDYFPSIGLPFSLSGMGLIGDSSFYTPQVNQPGSMGRFMLPAAVAGAIPPVSVGGGMKGLGAGTSMRRVGRLR